MNGETTFINTYQEREEVTLSFKANNSFLPDGVKATRDNQQLVKDTDYTYSYTTGEMKFKVLGNTNVVAAVECESTFVYKSDGQEMEVGFWCEGSFGYVD